MFAALRTAFGSLLAGLVREATLLAVVEPVGRWTVTSPAKTAVVTAPAPSWIAWTSPRLRLRMPTRPAWLKAIPRARKAVLALSHATISSVVAAAVLVKVPAETFTVTVPARRTSPPAMSKPWTHAPVSNVTARLAFAALMSNGPVLLLRTWARAAVVRTGTRRARGPWTKSAAVRNAPSRGGQASQSPSPLASTRVQPSLVASSMTVVWSSSRPVAASVRASVTTGASPPTKCVPLAGGEAVREMSAPVCLRGARSTDSQSWAAVVDGAMPALSARWQVVQSSSFVKPPPPG